MRQSGKIRTIEELAEVLASVRAENDDKKIVHCHGVFDLLHIGHIRHFEQAKKLGDVLVVTVTPDSYVNRGPDRPVFNENLRAEAIAALDCVDYVAINKWPMAVETISLLRPDFYVKGSEYRESEKDRTGGIILEEQAVKSVGGQIAFTDDITFSSSHLLNQRLSVFANQAGDYLTKFTERYSVDDVLRYLENARTLKVLVIGEAIIDEYQYCETLGKSGKEPILAVRYISGEKFAGGIMAVANNVAAFCDQVGMLTFLGAQDSQEDFIRENVDARIDMMFLYLDDAPTIVKRRFIEHYPLQKLFEEYKMGSSEDYLAHSQALCTKLRAVLPRYDVVIVTDYGHGMLGPEAIDILCAQAHFLAVNTQVNAANYGFNTVSKYHRADFICISEKEIRLEARSERRDIRDIVSEVAERLSCRCMLITQGQEGCLCYSKGEGFFKVSAFTNRIVDRLGAGDAVLSVTSLCAAQNAPVEVVGFIGNAVGAQAVTTVGHRKSIERVPLLKHIESLMK
jgi:rfaE bifunctional protein kinase chain/domain/rfaE bifunctional protein nucleotidyltransferase chain/domain